MPVCVYGIDKKLSESVTDKDLIELLDEVNSLSGRLWVPGRKSC